MCLVALSTLMLLVALERRQAVWWGIFTLASVGALYTHYTAIPVIAVQGAWALWAHRAQARQVLLAYLAIAAACLVWLPVVQVHDVLRNLSFSGWPFPLSFHSFTPRDREADPWI